MIALCAQAIAFILQLETDHDIAALRRTWVLRFRFRLNLAPSGGNLCVLGLHMHIIP